ncbi:YIP1 family protein [Bacillus sp. JCM 19041]|uniref:YIP1 family protein n=1 Tax=Bacillus sp. JCM 19041 TaxID=1460637 RepID=UPI0006D1FFD0
MKSWFKVWVNPREVTRTEIEKAREYEPVGKFLLIAYLSVALTLFQQLELAEPTFSFVILISLLGGVIGAPLSLYLMPLLLKWVGSWIGGTGSSLDLRVAVVNSSMRTGILAGVISLPFIFMVGEYYFLNAEAINQVDIQLSQVQVWALSVLLIIALISNIWIIVLSLHAIGEAHGFSAWKALLVEVILFAITVLVILIIAFIVAFFLMM